MDLIVRSGGNACILTRKKKKAVDLFIKYDLSPAAVIHELGYPSKNRLYQWYQEYISTGTLSDKKGRKSKYSKEQREAAVKYYLEHGKSVSKTIAALGYPKKSALCDWLNEDLSNEQRKWSCKRSGTLKRCSQEQKEKAVKEYCSGAKTPTQIASEYGVNPYTVYRWRDKLLGNKSIGHQKRFIPDIPLNPLNPPACHGIESCICYRDLPRLGTAFKHNAFVSSVPVVKSHITAVQKIVGEPFFDRFLLISGTDNKLIMTVKGIFFHNMPENGLPTNFNQRLRFIDRFL